VYSLEVAGFSSSDCLISGVAVSEMIAAGSGKRRHKMGAFGARIFQKSVRMMCLAT
jgi:hypothetical protein